MLQWQIKVAREGKTCLSAKNEIVPPNISDPVATIINMISLNNGKVNLSVNWYFLHLCTHTLTSCLDWMLMQKFVRFIKSNWGVDCMKGNNLKKTSFSYPPDHKAELSIPKVYHSLWELFMFRFSLWFWPFWQWSPGCWRWQFCSDCSAESTLRRRDRPWKLGWGSRAQPAVEKIKMRVIPKKNNTLIMGMEAGLTLCICWQTEETSWRAP